MKGGSQPLGTGTTFFNMNDFITPKSQQTPVAPAPTMPHPVAPAAPVPTMPAATPSWLRPRTDFHRAATHGDRSMAGRDRGGGGSGGHQNYMMEIIQQLMKR